MVVVVEDVEMSPTARKHEQERKERKKPDERKREKNDNRGK